MHTESPEVRSYAAFGLAVLIGGANFIAVTVSNTELPPVFGATIRFALAGAVFLLIARVGRVPLVGGRSALGAALYGLLGFGIAYAFLYYSLVGLPAGTAAVVVATVPLFTLAIAVLSGQERLTLRGLTGGVLAVAGIAALSLGSLGGSVRPAHLVAALVGAIALAASSVVAKALTEVHPLNMNAIGAAAGTAFLALTSLLLGEPWTLPVGTDTWLALAWLVLLGSVGLFQLTLYVIRRWTASAAVYVVAGMPVVAAVLGALLLDQPITPEVAMGGALVISAVYVGALSTTRAGPS